MRTIFFSARPGNTTSVVTIVLFSHIIRMGRNGNTVSTCMDEAHMPGPSSGTEAGSDLVQLCL